MNIEEEQKQNLKRLEAYSAQDLAPTVPVNAGLLKDGNWSSRFIDRLESLFVYWIESVYRIYRKAESSTCESAQTVLLARGQSIPLRLE